MVHASRVSRMFAIGGSMDLSAVKAVPANEPKLARVFWRAKRDYARLSETPDEFAVIAKAVSHMMATEPTYTAAEIATIRVPVAIAVGANDEFIKPEHTEYLARTIPNATLIVLPEVSHFAMLQQPDQFNAAMLAFLSAS